MRPLLLSLFFLALALSASAMHTNQNKDYNLKHDDKASAASATMNDLENGRRERRSPLITEGEKMPGFGGMPSMPQGMPQGGMPQMPQGGMPQMPQGGMPGGGMPPMPGGSR